MKETLEEAVREELIHSYSNKYNGNRTFEYGQETMLNMFRKGAIMKLFIILTTITGGKAAIRPSSVIYVEEIKGNSSKIQVKTQTVTWNISDKKHTIDDIVKEIEENSINEQQ